MRHHYDTNILIIIFTLSNSWISFSYPGGNFEGNQLPDSSISLSPLCSSLRIDLHVRTHSVLHQNFFWLQPGQVKFTVFRVLTNVLLLKPFLFSKRKNSWSVNGAQSKSRIDPTSKKKKNYRIFFFFLFTFITHQ